MKTAVLISCVLYGLVHSANPNAGILSTAIIVIFGYLRIYGYLKTGQLWLSIGMHTGWNFFQATVFGFAASGHAEDRTLLAHDVRAADWLSGGDFGPEASVLTIPVVLMALIVMGMWSGRRVPVQHPVKPS
jgi:membrane protease YdiL (CAAX protease family)